jgi:hypothetical protein
LPAGGVASLRTTPCSQTGALSSSHVPKDPPSIPASRNDRDTYRIIYPTGYPTGRVPHVRLEGELLPHPLIDCSERGIRFKVRRSQAPLAAGTRLMCELRMYETPPRIIGGVVVRVEADEAAVKLDEPGIPFRLVLAEERAVLAWTRSRV